MGQPENDPTTLKVCACTLIWTCKEQTSRFKAMCLPKLPVFNLNGHAVVNLDRNKNQGLG